MSGWYINPVGGLGVVIAASVVLLCAMMLASREMRRMPPQRRWTLVALRVTVFLLVIAAMLRITRVFTDIRQRPATLALLIDRSKSMQTADAFGDRPRWDALKEIIDQSLPLLSNMGENLEVKVYAFDRDISPVEFSNGQLNLGKTPDGAQSAIGAALDDVTRRESGKRIAGIILLSDGAQQAFAPRDEQPQTPARRLNDLPAPLFTVTFGQDRSANQARDVALTDLIASPSVFIKNDLSVAGTARVNGLVNQPIPVQMLFETSPGKMEVVATTTLRAKQNGEQLKFEMNYIPQTPGEKKLVLRAEPQSGERITTNNELSTFVNVLDGGLNVLYLEGRCAPEADYIARFARLVARYQGRFRAHRRARSVALAGSTTVRRFEARQIQRVHHRRLGFFRVSQGRFAGAARCRGEKRRRTDHARRLPQLLGRRISKNAAGRFVAAGSAADRSAFQARFRRQNSRRFAP